MSTRLGVGTVLVDGRLVPGDIVVDPRTGTLDLDLRRPGAPSLVACAGLVDIQVNGFAGVDVLTGPAADLARVEDALLATGVTAWQPTLITAPPETTEAALARLAALDASDAPGATERLRPVMLGVHLEGPFLAPTRRGAHPLEDLRDPDLDLLDRITTSPLVRTMTLAPERPGALALVERLLARGIVVSLGHSDADADAADAAFDLGASTVTHLGNTMRPLSARDPGLFGAALARDDVVVQVILDGHHLDRRTVRMIATMAAGRLVLVTDAVAAALDDGDARLGSEPVVVFEGAVRRADGTLAGSALTMPGAVRGAVAAGMDLADALTAATATPARVLGRDDIGTLRPGGPADVVVLDRDGLVLRRVLRRGIDVDVHPRA